MREWLSWWSATLPRSRPRVRVPSRAFFIVRKQQFLVYERTAVFYGWTGKELLFSMDISNINYDPLVEKYRDLVTAAADTLWEYAEPAFQEYRSCALLKSILEKQGFTVSVPSSSLPTAFMAQWGSGKPVIGLLGEYDALPGMSQAADIPSPSPLDTPGGHGCGHNLLGCGILAGALFLKDIMEEEKLPGTILYFGCPAEENAAGKAAMIKEGFFKDVDAAFSWHPHYKSGIFNQALANHRVYYTFHGISAHASQSPHLGRSALDACELMNIGVNYLREHMIDEARIHYAYTDAGGTAPNIIPARAQVFYAVRAPRSRDARLLRERVDDIARGAALMTGTKADIETACIYDSILPNPVLDRLVLKYLEKYAPVFTPEERSYAQDFVPFGNLPDAASPIDEIPDLSPTRKTGISTDVGNVSQILPCSAFMVSCHANGSPLHHWTVTAQGKSSMAHRGMFAAGKILSSCVLELLTHPELLTEAKKEFLNAKKALPV